MEAARGKKRKLELFGIIALLFAIVAMANSEDALSLITNSSNFTANVSGQPAISFFVTFVAGNNTTLTQSGNNITIDSTGGSGSPCSDCPNSSIPSLQANDTAINQSKVNKSGDIMTGTLLMYNTTSGYNTQFGMRHPAIQMNVTASGGYAFGAERDNLNASNNAPAYTSFVKRPNNSALISGDTLGSFYFWGMSSAATYNIAGGFAGYVDGSVQNNSVPSRICITTRAINNTATLPANTLCVHENGDVVPATNNSQDIGRTGLNYKRIWAVTFAGGEFADKGYNYSHLFLWNYWTEWKNESILSNETTIIGWNNVSTQRKQPINAENLYYSAVKLNRTTGNWDLACCFGTSASVGIIPADAELIEDSRLVILGSYKVKVYGNIKTGDKLIVSNRSGVLTNAYNLSGIKSLQYDFTVGEWKYVNLPASINPDIYNTYDKAQGVDATVAAISLENYNSTSTGIIKVKVLNT